MAPLAPLATPMIETGQKVIIVGFSENLGYLLHPETISPRFADLSSTTHVEDCVPRYSPLYPKQWS